MTAQPKWRCIANLGDQTPLDHGGYFVYRDTTKQYEEQAVLLREPVEGTWQYLLYRFTLDRLKMVTDKETHKVYLVPFGYDPETWHHPLHQYDEWFHDSLEAVGQFIGESADKLRLMLCDADPLERAQAYRSIGDYHGFDNLDSYPLNLTLSEARRHVPRKWGGRR